MRQEKDTLQKRREAGGEGWTSRQILGIALTVIGVVNALLLVVLMVIISALYTLINSIEARQTQAFKEFSAEMRANFQELGFIYSGMGDSNAKTLAENSKTLAENTKTLDESTRTLAENTKTLDESTRTLAENTKTLAELTRKVEDLGNRMAALETGFEILSSDIAWLKARLQDLQGVAPASLAFTVPTSSEIHMDPELLKPQVLTIWLGDMRELRPEIRAWKGPLVLSAALHHHAGGEGVDPLRLTASPGGL